MVSAMDATVGAVLGKLDELGLRDDTLVIFLSDNGHSTEERNNFGGGSAGRLRGAKFSLFEGGVRVPCIVSWPGWLPQNQERRQPAMNIDLVPTVAEVCGARPPKRTLDGRSLLPVLPSAEARGPHPVLHWQLGQQYAVRQGDWKLVVNGTDGDPKVKLPERDRVFLSNLAEDVSERTNLAAKHPQVVERLQRLHREWAAEVGKR
jgi:arylsulfatase A-like enzyme